MVVWFWIRGQDSVVPSCLSELDRRGRGCPQLSYNQTHPKKPVHSSSNYILGSILGVNNNKAFLVPGKLGQARIETQQKQARGQLFSMHSYSKLNLLVYFPSFQVFFTVSLHVNFDLFLPIFPLLSSNRIPLHTGVSGSLHLEGTTQKVHFKGIPMIPRRTYGSDK